MSLIRAEPIIMNSMRKQKFLRLPNKFYLPIINVDYFCYVTTTHTEIFSERNMTESHHKIIHFKIIFKFLFFFNQHEPFFLLVDLKKIVF